MSFSFGDGNTISFGDGTTSNHPITNTASTVNNNDCQQATTDNAVLVNGNVVKPVSEVRALPTAPSNQGQDDVTDPMFHLRFSEILRMSAASTSASHGNNGDTYFAPLLEGLYHCVTANREIV